MNKENKEKEDQNKHLVIPDNSEMEDAWNNIEYYKNKFPKPNLHSVWNGINKKLGWYSNHNTIPIYKKILRSAAAVILPLLIIGTLIYFSFDKINQKINYVCYNSPSGVRSKINLTDGSTIWLQPNSQIKYPKKFTSQNREIYFTGKAYFDISKNPEKPFVVHTNNMDVTVLGTRFYIKANSENDKVETGLISGKVKVSNSNFEKFLNPNDIVVYSRSKNKIIETKDLSCNAYKWDNGSLVFDNCEFGTILKDISDWYDIKLEISTELKVKNNLTLTIREESIQEIMEILKIVVPFKYNIEQNTLEISESN